MAGYVYHCVEKRPAEGNLPAVGLQYWGSFKTRKYSHAVGKPTWGYAVYSLRLTQDKMDRYGLIEARRD